LGVLVFLKTGQEEEEQQQQQHDDDDEQLVIQKFQKIENVYTH